MEKTIRNNMKKITLLIVALIYVSSSSIQAQENSLLWQISGNGLKETSYIFGTMHILCEDSIVNNSKLKEAFTNSKTLVLELDPTSPEVIQEIQQLSMNPGFENIYKDLPLEDYELVDGFLKSKFGAGLEQLGVMKPFTLTAMASMGFLTCQVPFSLETYFVNQATERNMQIGSLETVSSQMGIFDAIPKEDQINELIRLLKNNMGQAEMNQMIEVYLNGDLEAIHEVIYSNSLMDKYHAEILDDRNHNWIPQLEKYISSNSTFVAVGAGHLAGEMGLLSLLRKQGYNVEVVSW
jgi:uncharacterized protein YbaP (TraB family)